MRLSILAAAHWQRQQRVAECFAEPVGLGGYGRCTSGRRIGAVWRSIEPVDPVHRLGKQIVGGERSEPDRARGCAGWRDRREDRPRRRMAELDD